jgi:UPF0716 family protein affecting phage T7 exclusion
MSRNGSISPGAILLFALAALFGWVLLEYVLFAALARHIGTPGALLFHVLKGGLGLLLLAVALRRFGRGFKAAMRQGGVTVATGNVAAAVVGAILIALPGLVPSLFGLALFAPSLRALILARLFGRGPARPREIVLDRGDWREER